MEPKFKHPAPQSVPVDEGEPRVFPAPTQIPQPSPQFDTDYLDGDLSSLQGVNPGRDQDRSRVDECIPANYSYSSAGSDNDNSSNIFESEGF